MCVTNDDIDGNLSRSAIVFLPNSVNAKKVTENTALVGAAASIPLLTKSFPGMPG